MASTRPIALWGTQVPPGDGLIPLMAEIPATIRITMAAIDPTADPQGDGPKRATLKIIRRPIGMDDYQDSDEEESESESEEGGSEEESESENEGSTPKKKGEKKDGQMDVDEKSPKEKKEKKAADEESDDAEDEDEDFETEEFVVCTLDTDKNYQQPLDIAIGEEEIIYFKVTGTYDVYLTGNYVHYESTPDHDEDSEDDEDYDLSPSEDELDIFGEESDELDDIDNPSRIQELPSDNEGEEARPMTKKEKKRAAASSSANSKTEEQKKTEVKKRPAEDEKQANGEKLSKKQQKKLKNNDGKAVDVSTKAETTPSKSEKRVNFAKGVEQGPATGEKAKPPKSGSKDPGPRKVNGVTIDDKTIGTGPAAKKGDKAVMRYIGKLSDGKVFDSNTKGKPFSFTIGKGEVIKGWDLGIVGMQRGGERRLIIPPELGYGKKSLPGIPANSTMTFDVKLLEIK